MAAQDRAITLKQFARLLDVSPSYVTELKHSGRLVLDEAGRVMVEASKVRIADTADPAKDAVRARHAAGREAARVDGADAVSDGDNGTDTPRYDPDDPIAIRRARAIADKAEAEARKALREEQAELGQLLRADDVEFAMRAAIATLRNGLENLPAILAPQVAAESDEAKCRVMLTDSMEHALEELARQFAAIGKAEAA